MSEIIAICDINLETITEPNELLKLGLHAGTVKNLTEKGVNSYISFTVFPYMKAELESDGYIHLRLSKDESQDSIRFAPKDWDKVMIYLRDEYFNTFFKNKAGDIRKESIIKAYNIENPE